MFTTTQTITIALLFALVVAVAVAWLTFAACNHYHWKRVEPLQQRVNSLEARLDIEAVRVVLYDTVTDAFVRIEKFGTDLYAALAFCSQVGIRYNLELKVQRKSGEYIVLNLINT